MQQLNTLEHLDNRHRDTLGGPISIQCQGKVIGTLEASAMQALVRELAERDNRELLQRVIEDSHYFIG